MPGANDPDRDDYERVVAATHPPGLYESHYLKANAPDGSAAVWLKHNVLSPAPDAGMAPVAELWCVLWRASNGWRPEVWKHVVPLEAVELGTDRVAIRTPVAGLEPARAGGALPSRGEQPAVSWELAIRDELPPLRHFAADWMYTAGFPRKKVVTGSPRAVFDGHLEVGGERVPVAGWVGHRNHNWGTEHALRYAYGSCNVWDDGADLTVEGFTVQVRLLGPVRSPWTTMVTGLDHARPYGLGTVAGALRSAGRLGWPVWVAHAPTADGRHARLRMELDPAHAAGLRYLHPDGSVSCCYNVKDARVELLLGGERHTSTAGELEFLFPEPVPGIPLHGGASLDELRARVVAS